MTGVKQIRRVQEREREREREKIKCILNNARINLHVFQEKIESKIENRIDAFSKFIAFTQDEQFNSEETLGEREKTPD